MSGETKAIYEKLKARFPIEAHKTKSIGGRDLIYVDGETVISRLNDALGFDGWAFEVVDVTILEEEVCARGRLTVYLGTQTVVREQAGGQIINRTKGIPAQLARPPQEADGDRPAIPAVEAKPAVKGAIIEVSNDVKGAITDCLKKCASLIGVGLYLFDPVARREIAAEMRGVNRAAPSNPTPRGANAPTPAANPGTQASRSAGTPSTSPVESSSSSTTATSAPTPINEKVRDAAILTGANPNALEQRWQRLVAEAERIKLPTLGQVKAIDPKAISEAQLKSYADLLENRIYEAKGAA